LRFLTETENLTGPCGNLGSIRAVDLWQSRESISQAKELVANIASLSYGNDAAKNPEKLFDSIVERGHLSCLEFVPFVKTYEDDAVTLPSHSLRGYMGMLDSPNYYFNGFNYRAKDYPATAFLVEAPILTVRQWFRHRAFSYLEMSRRYVKGSKVPFDFYGHENAERDEADFYGDAIKLYDRLIASGEPPERARRVIPVGAMTKFWAGGYNHDWRESFVRLRSENHAQTEIRLFSEYIADVVK